MTAAAFRTSIDRLLNQVGHWEQGRWSARPPSAAAGSGPSRADLVYALVQRLADLSAGVEGRPDRTVPRLSDLVLPDQLRVMADDLVAVCPGELLDPVAKDVDTTRHALT